MTFPTTVPEEEIHRSVSSRAKERDALAKKVAAFLERGGEINQVGYGARVDQSRDSKPAWENMPAKQARLSKKTSKAIGAAA